MRWKCMLCGRDKFIRKSPHYCSTGFRKRKIIWKPIYEDMKTGIEVITEERIRQKEIEGWTKEHDAQHTEGELAIAAACYAFPNYNTNAYIQSQLRWPFEGEWWKPGDRIRELAKAGALIAAEIDRLQAPPPPKINPNFDELKERCQEYLIEPDEDVKQEIFEAALDAIFGEDIWEYINRK